ncbi:MAG: DUF2797 domain-containing protein [Ectothiorhodospiraceae bacterium]|nr:DUF2797 domain-containing protein [Chromatiales bacterium]MCP5153724.1 DUF2797 domain-containing protein [Ectothiorhodospiraceae bacterium]
MRVEAAEPVSYALRLGSDEVRLDQHLGATLSLAFTGAIHCVACGRATRRSFGQGHCYPCFTRLAACDTCIVRPELCHFDAGTCREPDWGLDHCMRPHVVYLANSSGLKVGITRETQIPTRWIDQGAVAAVPVLRVGSRRASGLVEAALKDGLSDRTDWRAMLRGDPEAVDLEAARASLRDRLDAVAAAAAAAEPRAEPVELSDAEVRRFTYPVLEYPIRVRSLDPTKVRHIEGTLLGIKGQYLILDVGVLNVRRFAGYEVEMAVTTA